MRVVSYNLLHGGQASEGIEERSDALLRVLQGAKPDLLWLCECNGFEDAGPGLLQRLERALGMQGVLARASSGFHVALLARDARWSRVQRLDEGFTHAALRADLHVNGIDLRVLGAHLDPWDAGTRLGEVQRLLHGRPGVRHRLLLGDLNAISPADAAGLDPSRWPARYRDRHRGDAGELDGRAIAAIERAGLVDVLAGAGAARPTRPTALYAHRDVPAQRLDYIFASAELAGRVRHAWVLDDATAQQASDHLPVCADFD